jgi:hypothetical protein
MDGLAVVQNRTRREQLLPLLLIVGCLGSLLAWGKTARAATISVTSSVQEQPFDLGNGTCTLGEAIQAANTDLPVDACSAGYGADTIVLEATTYAFTASNNTPSGFGANALPSIISPITIVGNGAVLSRGSTVPAFRLVHAHGPNARLRLYDVSLLGGSAIFGGALFNEGGSAELVDSTLSNNVSVNGGAIANTGVLTLTTMIVSGNIGANAGGGVYNRGAAWITESEIAENRSIIGGGIENAGVVTMTASMVRANHANYGGGLAQAVAANGRFGTTYINRSMIADNEAIKTDQERGEGGGVYNTGQIEAVNSTISGNRAYRGGGIENTSFPPNYYGSARFAHSTITANSAGFGGAPGGQGGGVRVAPQSIVALDHTILAGNSAPDIQTSDCGSTSNVSLAGEVASAGYNLIGPIPSCTITGVTVGNIVGADPALEPLHANGGPTLTHALRAGSPARDAGLSVYTGPLLTDQRGVGYERVVNGRIDIGAVEMQADSASPTATSTETATATNSPTATATNGPVATASTGPTIVATKPVVTPVQVNLPLIHH